MSRLHLTDIRAALTNVRFRGKADMAERGVSHLVSVDLRTAVQFREAGQSNPFVPAQARTLLQITRLLLGPAFVGKNG